MHIDVVGTVWQDGKTRKIISHGNAMLHTLRADVQLSPPYKRKNLRGKVFFETNTLLGKKTKKLREGIK